jgi:hypothetical protein
VKLEIALLVALASAPMVSTAADVEDPAVDEAGASAQPAEPAEARDRAPATPAPLYVPPELGAPAKRVAAGTRGAGSTASVQALAPDHVGVTTREQPTLYWYLAQPTSTRIDFAIRDETSVAPLLDVQLPAPTRAGIQAVRLADHGVRLRPEVDYQWFVSLVGDPERRSKDVTTGGWIRMREPDATLRERLRATPPGREAFAYAESGVWYEAIDAVSSALEATPGDAGLHAQRAALLDQAGLPELAAHDREGGAGTR